MVWIAGHSLQNGRYTIQGDEPLGQGGFGITYKALHTRLNVPVVIKTPNGHLRHDPDYAQYVRRFIKEGQRLAQLSQDPHPHIVRAWDLFEEGDIPCMVMDFVPGENLFQLVRRRGALPEAEIVPCIRQIGEALSVIHQVGLVHRDAHPGNIIVRPEGRAILIDFGIAKELTPSTQSSTGKTGNKGFAPYEQFSRGSREPTVDVYCLAATLYFAVTGQRPLSSLDRRLHDIRLTAPKRIEPGLSEYLNQAILIGMALEAKDRPQLMQEWLSLLKEPEVKPQNNSPPQVEPAYRREAFNFVLNENGKEDEEPSETASPKAATPHENGKKDKEPQKTLSFKAITSLRTIPWIRLAIVLAGYATVGTSFGVSSAPLGAGTLAITLAVTLCGFGASGSAGGVPAKVAALAGFGAGTVGVAALAVALARLAALIIAVPTGSVVIVVWAGAGAGAGDRLLESFSRSHTFLILAGTSLAGLGLGWLIGTMWRSSGFTFPTFGTL